MAKTIAVPFLLGFLVYGQAPTGRPEFEVVSIKPAFSPTQLRDKGLAGRQPIANPGRYEMHNVSMRVLISEAYKLAPFQKVVGPEWIDKEFFDLAAKLPQGANKKEAPEMLQTLLAERCKLAVHWETRDEKAYVLSVAENGPKLQKASADADWDAILRQNSGRTFLIGGRTENGWIAYFSSNGNVVVEANRVTLTELALFLAREVDLPLIDTTGLNGLYKVSLPVPGTWWKVLHSKSSAGNASEASEPAGVDLVKSFEKLGLRLERGRAPVKQLVVDYVVRVPVEK